MQKKIIWEVIPLESPLVVRTCSKCGNNSKFVNQGNFRINANQGKIDVWLIYQCRKCKSTWNMTILSRVKQKDIKPEMYEKFQCNDYESSRKYSFDVGLHFRNKSILEYGEIEYEIKGEDFVIEVLSEPIIIEIVCNVETDLRMDKVLSLKLGISRSQVKKMFEEGSILSEDQSPLNRIKIKTKQVVMILPRSN